MKTKPKMSVPGLKKEQAGKADAFVKAAARHSTEATKRITIDLEPDLHKRMKIKAATDDCTLADLVRAWADQHC